MPPPRWVAALSRTTRRSPDTLAPEPMRRRLATLKPIFEQAAAAFPLFFGIAPPRGAQDDAELYRTLKLAKELGVIVTAHCENETLVAERCKELLSAGKTDPGQHHESRPPAVEAREPTGTRPNSAPAFTMAA